MKRVICLILCVIFTLPLVSCSGSYGDLQLYNAAEIDLPADISFDWQSLGFADGRLKLRGYDADTAQSEAERDNDKRKYTIYEYAGAEFQPCENQIGAESLASFELSSCSCVVNAEFAGNHYRYMTIVCYGSNGDILAEYDCETLFDIDLSDYKRNSDTGLYSILCAAEFEDELYFVSSSGAVRIGNEITRVDSDKNIYFANLYDGELAVETADGIFTVDFDSGELVDENLKLPLLAETISLPGYLFGSVDNSIVSGWKRSGGKIVEEIVCDLVCTGITGSLKSIACETTDTLYVSLYDSSEERDRLWRLDLIDDSERIELLTVAIVGLADSASISAIAEYNRAHIDTKLRVIRYEPVYDVGRIYIETAREAFEQDLADGRIPDILIVDMDTRVNISDYESSLPLCDLYELMDDAYRENLLPFVRHFERTDSEGTPSLYYLPLESSISLYAGSAAVINKLSELGYGDESDVKLTLGAVLDLLSSLSDNQCLVNEMKFSDLLYCSLEEFVDLETGETDFDSELFCRFVEAYREYGDNYRHNGEYIFDDVKWQAVKSGELLLCDLRLGAIQLMKILGKYGISDLAPIGYPDRGGSGILLEPDYCIAITESCDNKTAAFEFLSLRTQDNYLTRSEIYDQIPYLTHSALDGYIESLPRYYCFSTETNSFGGYDEPKSAEYLTEKFGEGYVEFEVDDEATDLLREVIYSAEPISDTEREILSIVMEQLELLAGESDLSAEEIAQVIDKSVSDFLH